MKPLLILYHWCCIQALAFMVYLHLEDEYYSEVAFDYHMRKVKHLDRLKELKG